MTSKQVIPGWIVGVVIIVMLGVSIYTVVQTQSALGWRASNIESPKNLSEIFFPGVTAVQNMFAAQPEVATAPVPPAANESNAVPVPTISAGAVASHGDRGTCTSCHTVLSSRGAPIPVIALNALPPHDNRGVCMNCHVVNGAGQGAMGNSPPVQVPTIVAGSTPVHESRGECTSCHTVLSKRGVPIPGIQVNSRSPHDNRGVCTNCHMLGTLAPFPASAVAVAAPGAGLNATPVAFVGNAIPVAFPGPAAPVAPPTEGGWNGVEVTPITTLTANQYGVPLGTVGLIVAEVEGAGAVAGLKAGDVVSAVNGVPTPTLTDFFQATGNGLMPKGFVTAYRKGQPLALVVDAAATTPMVSAMVGGIPMAGTTMGGIPMAPVQATPAPVQPPPPEGEWLGLEVAPISPLTATQYNLPPGLQGLIIIEAEAQAAAIGVRAGDVLQFVNGVAVMDMTTFFHATKNGTATQGTIVAWRKGQQMVSKISQTVAAATAATAQQAPPAPVQQPSASLAPVQPLPPAPQAAPAPSVQMPYAMAPMMPQALAPPAAYFMMPMPMPQAPALYWSPWQAAMPMAYMGAPWGAAPASSPPTYAPVYGPGMNMGIR